MAKYFTFIADTIDNKIQEFPVAFNLLCGKVKPLGCDIVKQFNKTECIVAKKVFQVYYQGQVFGSTQFTSVAQFVMYMNNACKVFCTPANLTINNCYLNLNGCQVKLYVKCPQRNLLVNKCNLTINGCNLVLN